MMKVTLEIVAGLHTGQRIVVQNGLISRFGQTEWADFSFPLDTAMAPFHFALDCRDRRCVLHSTHDGMTCVNSVGVEQQLLMHGDTIRAGETEFLIAIDGMDEGLLASANASQSEDSYRIDPFAAAALAMTAAELCIRLELDADAMLLAKESATSSELINRLAAQGDYRQALRVRAFTLGRRPAIAWGCYLVQAQYSDAIGTVDAGDLQQAGLVAAVAWTHSPDQHNASRAGEAAERAAYEGSGGMLAAAAFWSGDNIAPATSPEPVRPDDALSSCGVAAALSIAIYARPEPPIEEQFKRYMDVAAAVELGDMKLYES